MVFHCNLNEACGFSSKINNDVCHIMNNNDCHMLTVWISSLIKRSLSLFKFLVHSLNYCSFMVSLKVWKWSSLTLFFFFKIILDILVPLSSYINFRINLPISSKKCLLGFWLGLAWNFGSVWENWYLNNPCIWCIYLFWSFSLSQQCFQCGYFAHISFNVFIYIWFMIL